MTHVTCPKCLGNDHIQGYGLAAGSIGAYTICDCGALLEYCRDVSDMTADQLADLVLAMDNARLAESLAGGRNMVEGDIFFNALLQRLDSETRAAWRSLMNEACKSTGAPLQSELVARRMRYRNARQCYIDAGGDPEKYMAIQDESEIA